MFSKVALVTALLVLAFASESAAVKLEKESTKRSAKSVRSLNLKDAPFAKRESVEEKCNGTDFDCEDGLCVPYTFVCDAEPDCTTGKDEENCVQDCTGAHMFECQGGDKKCVSVHRRCDNNPDCKDWSDEAACINYECLEGYDHCLGAPFECFYSDYRCDQYADCEDGSDEQGCSTECDADAFMCKAGLVDTCFHDSDKCDSYVDCDDASDENESSGCTGGSDSFQCKLGNFIPSSWKCDGDLDCPGGGDDEADCGDTTHSFWCSNLMSHMGCHYMDQSSRPICSRPADAKRYCRQYCGLCSDTGNDFVTYYGGP